MKCYFSRIMNHPQQQQKSLTKRHAKGLSIIYGQGADFEGALFRQVADGEDTYFCQVAKREGSEFMNRGSRAEVRGRENGGEKNRRILGGRFFSFYNYKLLTKQLKR